MTETKVTLTDTTAIMPLGLYLQLNLCVVSMGRLLDAIEGVEDDLYQASVLREAVYLLLRIFPFNFED